LGIKIHHLMLVIQDLHKSYDTGKSKLILKGINLNISEGEFVSIMGSSGSENLPS
jgi:putative ABC transport system ATP-binding protein